eukprot:g62505.t1
MDHTVGVMIGGGMVLAFFATGATFIVMTSSESQAEEVANRATLKARRAAERAAKKRSMGDDSPTSLTARQRWSGLWLSLDKRRDCNVSNVV